MGGTSAADEDLITSYEEKPKVPKGHLAVPPFYFYRREDVKRLPEALAGRAVVGGERRSLREREKEESCKVKCL